MFRPAAFGALFLEVRSGAVETAEPFLNLSLRLSELAFQRAVAFAGQAQFRGERRASLGESLVFGFETRAIPGLLLELPHASLQFPSGCDVLVDGCLQLGGVLRLFPFLFLSVLGLAFGFGERLLLGLELSPALLLFLAQFGNFFFQ